MKVPGWILVVALALALLAVTALPAARAATSMPTWSVGDWWSYSINGEAGGTIPPLGNGTVRYDVVGTESIQVGSSTVSAYHTKVNYTVVFSYGSFSATVYLNGDEWFRTSDLAPAKLGFSASVLGNTMTVTGSYNPPPDIHWPLTAGSTWSVTTTLTLVTDFFGTSNSTTSTETLANSVGADQSITVTAGTFTATPLNQSMGSGHTVAYWSASAGNSVSQKSYDDRGNETGKMDLKAYNYQGGGFLNTSVLGIPLLYWLIVVAVVVVAVVAIGLMRRRKRRMLAPPAQPPQMMPPSPPPPGSPP